MEFVGAKKLCVTYPVFALSHLEHFELLPTGALGHLPLDLIVNPLGVGERTPVLPIRSQGSHEFSPVDHPVAMVEFVCHCVHFKLGRRELCLQDSINEFVPGAVAITILVQFAEEVLDARLLVVVVLEVALAPILPVEVLDLLKLLEVVQLVLQPPVALPCHHPDMPPLVPESLGPWVLDALFTLAYAGTAGEGECQGGQGAGKTMARFTSVIASMCLPSLPAVSREPRSSPSVRCGTVTRARTAGEESLDRWQSLRVSDTERLLAASGRLLLHIGNAFLLPYGAPGTPPTHICHAKMEGKIEDGSHTRDEVKI